jgi:hypothetical protein
MGGLTVKRWMWWRCLTKIGEVDVFRCLGVVEASPVKEGGEECARVWMRKRGGGGGGVGRCSTLLWAWRPCGDGDKELGGGGAAAA